MDTLTYNYPSDVKTISHIDIDILGNDEIRRQSVIDNAIGIQFPVLYENNEPVKLGLVDPRLGTSENNTECATCGLDMVQCVGHFGHIELADHVFHIGYIQHVVKILNCICLRCSKLLIHTNEVEIKEILKSKVGKERLNYIKNATKNITHCLIANNGCGARKPKISINSKKTSALINIKCEFDSEDFKQDDKEGKMGKSKVEEILTADMIYNILRNISDEDSMLLGINPLRSRPENMIQKIFPVPPIQMRPSAKGNFLGGSVLEDDLTHKLADIVKQNKRMLETKEKETEAGLKFLQEAVQLLQYHTATYFDNDSLMVVKSEQKNKPFKSVVSRLKTKTGRVRGNLMGKRTDFCARTVITSEPAIDYNYVGVPLKIAMNLTIPEVVTPYNINILSQLVENGREKYPGANFVFPINNKKTNLKMLPIDLRYRKDKLELHVGDIVERHLQTGDMVLLNRQPTLHKQSMMGLRIKVVDNPNLMTFRISVAVCKPYGADFDGDEMNIFIPQSIQTKIELEEIAAVEYQLITPTTSQTIIGIVQDGLIGAYNLTEPNLKIGWRDVMNLITYTSINNFTKIKKKKEYAGKDVYSMIIPSVITTLSGIVKIKNGVILEGRIGNSMLGPNKKNNLIQIISDGCGIEATKKFINDTQKLANNFNLYYGFSMGICDLELTKETKNDIFKMIETKELECNHYITQAENNFDLYKPETYELKLFSDLGVILDNAGKMVKSKLRYDNAIAIMSDSGSKGNINNIGQIIACVGLQSFEGKMIPKKYNDRTLAYYYQNDDRAIARGLVKQSFYSGLEFPEFVLTMISGRQGLIETAIKTADTGYTQRRLVKLMEDLIVKYDCTVRTANESLIQLVYGNSGADTTKQYDYLLKSLELNNEDIIKKHKFMDNDYFVNEVIALRNELRTRIHSARLKYMTMPTNFMLPVNITRIIDTNSNIELGNTKLEYDYVIDRINEILRNDKTKLMCFYKNEKTDVNSLKYKDDMAHKLLFKFALYDALTPKRVMDELKLTKEQFDKIVDDIIINFNKNIIEPGEMIGIITAQSMGEPLTQLTLSSVDWNEFIEVHDKLNDNSLCLCIGDFIDNLINKHKKYAKKYIPTNNEEEDPIYLDIEALKYFINSVDQYGKITEKLILGVSKHLPINKDRTRKLIEVRTRTGKTVKATMSKSFLTRKENLIVPTRGDELKVGDYVPIQKSVYKQYEIADLESIERIPILLSCLKGKMPRGEIKLLMDSKKFNKCDYEIMKIAYESDVYYDEIVSINIVKPTKTYVYDLTVEDNKTFCLYNGFCCMDTFHFAGISSVSATLQGLPRMKELLNVSKKPKKPQMIIYLTNEYANNKALAYKVASNIKYTTIKQIRKKITVYYDPNPSKSQIVKDDNVTDIFYRRGETKKGCQKNVDDLPWLIRIEINREQMLEKEVTLLEIKSKFCNWWERRYIDQKLIKKDEKKIISKITQLAILSNTDNDDQPVIHIRFNIKDTDKDKFNIDTLNGFIDIIIDRFKLKGIPNINDITAIVEERNLVSNLETGELDKKMQYVIYASGVNLVDIRYITGIDVSRTICNEVLTVYETFGIEIARAVLLRELIDAYDKAGGVVNYQHISLIVDLMTASGEIMSIDRHGMVKSDTDALSRATFEKTVEQLLTASVFGETDHMKGISARIMSGQVIKGGTGFCDVELDSKFIENSEYLEGYDINEQFTEIDKSTLLKDLLKDKKID